MANFICEFEGVRGRNLKLYDTKIIITTKLAANIMTQVVRKKNLINSLVYHDVEQMPKNYYFDFD